MNKTRIIFLALTLLTCITIFIFSNQNGEESGETSRGFTKKIIDICPITKNLNEKIKEELTEKTQKIIRKLAHFSIYTILGINLMGLLNTYDGLENKTKAKTSLIIGVIYAISDEIHQMFSGGRTPAILDVCIDGTGILFGIIIVFGIVKIINNNDKRPKIAWYKVSKICRKYLKKNGKLYIIKVEKILF